MSVSLESVVPAQEEPAVIEETIPAPEEPAPSARSMPEEPPEEPPAALSARSMPAPKKRGRPKKDPTAKTPAPKKAVRMETVQPPTPESSDADEPLNRNDMETMLLDFLLQRKQSQQNVRRTMWAQLASLR